ncbi:hypothetical protein EH230_07945 [Flavobacterium columnare]|uniref:RHS repeat-associated core domain-containing protein n=1 Tax=Flavobacterium columnare TaxID=996 RepID=A0A437UB14_9FLAO|nr:RHS repeat-associated core domain-containing protein [Flavobacterium columnare]RVU90830.1 hypothetical protein EH230_07915 [Flavobacterium columnare]RVU90836.1 hypothetical protein EH230_07945 [Flavobacterium columnare]
MNYYPFGSLIPNRHGASTAYRYGFQGQEKDDELKGEGNSLNYTFRMHDPRLGRFFTTDPLEAKFPFYSPYAFSGNRVIDCGELEGLEPYSANLAKIAESRRSNFQKALKAGDIEKANYWYNQYKAGIKAQTYATAAAVAVLSFPFLKNKAFSLFTTLASNPVLLTELAATTTGFFYEGSEDFFPQAKGDELAKIFRGTGKKVLDFFGGKISKYDYAFNVDIAALKGFKGKIDDFTKIMGRYNLLGTVDNIIADNPFGYKDYLVDASKLLKEGGTITVRGGLGNKFFNQVVNGTAEGLNNFEIIQEATKLSKEATKGMKTSGGKEITHDVYEIILKKKS